MKKQRTFEEWVSYYAAKDEKECTLLEKQGLSSLINSIINDDNWNKEEKEIFLNKVKTFEFEKVWVCRFTTHSIAPKIYKSKYIPSKEYKYLMEKNDKYFENKELCQQFCNEQNIKLKIKI